MDPKLQESPTCSLNELAEVVDDDEAWGDDWA